MRNASFIFATIVATAIMTFGSGQLRAQEPWSFPLPEQTSTEIRRPSQLQHAPIPVAPRPTTVLDPKFDGPARQLTLSEAINTGLENLDVVRVLAGVTAVSSGRTVYDMAIANTRIDQERGAFDPNLNVNNGWSRNETPSAAPDPLDPTRSRITGSRNDGYGLDVGLTKRTLTGGVIDFGVNSNGTELRPGVFPLNPSSRASTDLSYTQPLLQGGGVAANQVPIVLARIETERSFFQYKDSVQSHVQGVIEAYWNLVSARTNLWVREQQVAQLQFIFERNQARLEVGDASAGEAAQARVAYENFRATLIGARADVLQREAALRNILGLPPYDSEQLVPVSPLIDERIEIDWDGIVSLAETQRPDIIELKLVLEADEQRLLLSRNQASSKLDAIALYRWNGLEGEMPNGQRLASQPGQFGDWNLGVNFSVPLGLRRDRAQLRQQELIIQRDRINLQQGLHQTVHTLALNIRNLDQFHEQYQRFKAVREAAKINLDQQLAQSNEGLINFIVVLQAVTDWGNSVSSEALALVQYNTELARLERETGSILETHGVAFYEERYGSLAPLGRLADQLRCYPHSTHPTSAVANYGNSNQPSEEFFNLVDPLEAKSDEDAGEETEEDSDEDLDDSDDSEDKASELDERRKGGRQTDEDSNDSEPDATDSAKRKFRLPKIRTAQRIRNFFKR